MKRPETILADAAEQANTLRLFGQIEVATQIHALVGDLKSALREYLTWHDEAGAIAMSEKPAGWFRNRRREWQGRGLAERRGRSWYYREVVIPRRADVQSATAEALADARKDLAA